jgi:hypothetical protein
MKARMLKIAVILFLVAVLVEAGVYPMTSQAADKGTTYNVTVQKGSPTVSLVSANNGAPMVNPGSNETSTFQMIVGSKLKTEKVKSTGGTASYYEVTIPKKSWRSRTDEYPNPSGGTLKQYSVLKGDAKGKLYVSGGDVDVSSVLSKKVTSTIGDGTANPAGSFLIKADLVTYLTDKSTGKNAMTLPMSTYFTTGKSSITAKGTKSKLEGKTMPNDDTTKSLTTPLVGQPIDLEAGTGTLVATPGALYIKTKVLGVSDFLIGEIYVMKITK